MIARAFLVLAFSLAGCWTDPIELLPSDAAAPDAERAEAIACDLSLADCPLDTPFCNPPAAAPTCAATCQPGCVETAPATSEPDPTCVAAGRCANPSLTHCCRLPDGTADVCADHILAGWLCAY